MLQALGQLLPIGFAASLSSVPIAVMLVIVLSPQRGRLSVPYLVGWVVGSVLVLTGVVLLGAVLPPAPPRQPDLVAGILGIVIGLAIVGTGVYRLVRGGPKEPAAAPAWVGRLNTLHTTPIFGVGLLLNLRPKALLLAAAAALSVHRAAAGVGTSALLIAVYVILATATVSIPVLLTLRSPGTIEPRLIALRDWLAANGTLMTALIMILVGLVVAGLGLSELPS